MQRVKRKRPSASASAYALPKSLSASMFWAVVGANIARVDFRLFFGYRLIFAAIWFVIGVLCFTFLPC